MNTTQEHTPGLWQLATQHVSFLDGWRFGRHEHGFVATQEEAAAWVDAKAAVLPATVPMEAVAFGPGFQKISRFGTGEGRKA